MLLLLKNIYSVPFYHQLSLLRMSHKFAFYTNRADILDSTTLTDQAEALHNHTDSPLKPSEVKLVLIHSFDLFLAKADIQNKTEKI